MDKSAPITVEKLELQAASGSPFILTGELTLVNLESKFLDISSKPVIWEAPPVKTTFVLRKWSYFFIFKCFSTISKISEILAFMISLIIPIETVC